MWETGGDPVKQEEHCKREASAGNAKTRRLLDGGGRICRKPLFRSLTVSRCQRLRGAVPANTDCSTLRLFPRCWKMSPRATKTTASRCRDRLFVIRSLREFSEHPRCCPQSARFSFNRVASHKQRFDGGSEARPANSICHRRDGLSAKPPSAVAGPRQEPNRRPDRL